MPIRIVNTHNEAETTKVNLYGLPDPDPAAAQVRAGVSLCMIMKNEERFIEQCLTSVIGVVDEICIVDTGSTDRSVEIAERMGARVEHHAWQKDFSWARNKANVMATYRWILSLDADEEITAASGAVIRAIGQVPADVTAVAMHIKNVTTAQTPDSTFSHFLPRFFPNNPRMSFVGAVHERLTVDDHKPVEMVDAPLVILHWGYQPEVVDERNKFERNMPLIRAEAEANPDDPFCLFNLGTALATSGMVDEGAEALERMFTIAKERHLDLRVAYLPPSFCTLASCYVSKNRDFAKAISVLEECLEYNPHYPNAHFLKASFHHEIGETDEERKALLAAVGSQDRSRSYSFVDDDIALWKAKYYLALGYAVDEDFDSAVLWIDRARLARPNSYELARSRAQIFERAERHGEAEKTFSELYSEFGTDAAFGEYLQFLLRRKRYARAMEIINRQIEQLGKDAQVTALIAAASLAHKLETGDPHAYLNRALALDPEPQSGDTIRALDDLYLELEEPEAREALRRREIANPPACIVENDWHRRTHRLLQEQQYVAAAEAAQTALKEFPKNTCILYNGALAHYRQGDIPQAIAYLDDMTSFPERDLYLQGQFLRVLLLREAGRAAEALESIEILHAAEPQNVDICILRASLLEAEDRQQDAVSVLKACVEEPTQRVVIELASLYMRTGRFNEARELADLALSGSVHS